MIQIQSSIQKCVAKIIQHNSVLKNIFDEIYQQSGRVLLVGGAVRDCFIAGFDAQSTDLDFEVYHISLENLEQILQQFGKVSFVGKSFGVLRLHGIDADWSVPRQDSFGRKPSVKFDPNMSFEQAFKRRDLTINAMGIDLHSLELIDPYHGLRDLYNKVLRSPDPEFFIQDPLRLFRVMQFTARFNMHTDDKLDELCRTMDISNLASERIEAEFEKMIVKSERPSLGLAWLQKINRFEQIFPDIIYDQRSADAIDCVVHQDLYKEKKIAAFWGFITSGLQGVDFTSASLGQKILPEMYKKLKEFVKRYVHAMDIVDDAVMIAWYHHYIPLFINDATFISIKWFAFWVSPRLNIKLFSEIAGCWYEEQVVNLFIQKGKEAEVFELPEEALLQGKDLLQFVQGKELGDLLKKAYEMQINQHINKKDRLLELVMKEIA